MKIKYLTFQSTVLNKFYTYSLYLNIIIKGVQKLMMEAEVAQKLKSVNRVQILVKAGDMNSSLSALCHHVRFPNKGLITNKTINF